MMDAEKLRDTYDRYFSGDKNKWSSTDKRKTIKVAKATLGWARRLGFKKINPTLLDIGCATGFYTEAFRLEGCISTGLDYSTIAIEKAKAQFPACNFVQMNGFEPEFEQQFDLMFCRGFSGTNTHDLDFIASWINKYLKFLATGGFFILAYSSNFSGIEEPGTTVNHSKHELEVLSKKIEGDYRGLFIFYYFGWFSRTKRKIEKLFKKDTRDYFYLFIQKR
jgi:SAM-dependent methyltransferase